jgi:RNase P/RNase MRP subunit p29
MSIQVGDKVEVIDQNITGIVVETYHNTVVIEDDDSEWEWPENRLAFKISEVKPLDSEVIDKVLAQIEQDVKNQDFTAIVELLQYVPIEKLKGFLSEVN